MAENDMTFDQAWQVMHNECQKLMASTMVAQALEKAKDAEGFLASQDAVVTQLAADISNIENDRNSANMQLASVQASIAEAEKRLRQVQNETREGIQIARASATEQIDHIETDLQTSLKMVQDTHDAKIAALDVLIEEKVFLNDQLTETVRANEARMDVIREAVS